CDAEQDAEPGADRAARSDRRASDALDDRPQLSVEIEDAGRVGLRPWLHRARELVVPVRLGRPPLALERAAECVMRVVVGRREHLDDRAELALSVLPPRQAEVRDSEGFPDRRLLRLELLRPLERHGRLGGHSLPEPLLAFAKELVGVAHDRYGMFSRT